METAGPRLARHAARHATPRVMTNRLYYGDNLEVLREHIADASVDRNCKHRPALI